MTRIKILFICRSRYRTIALQSPRTQPLGPLVTTHLDKDEKRLVPKDRQNSTIVLEFDKVKDESVDDAKRQSVFLVQQSLDEDAVSARVVHLGQF